MNVCKYLERCPIAKYFGSTGWQKFQKRYCEGDFTSCNRFKIAETGTKPPEHLMPWDDVPTDLGWESSP